MRLSMRFGLKGGTAAMEQSIFRGGKSVRLALSMVTSLQEPRILESPEAAWGERRRYAFSQMGHHHSPVDAEFQAMSWAKL